MNISTMGLLESNLNNRSILAIESDLEAIEDRESHSFSPNNDSSLLLESTETSNTMHGVTILSLKGFVQHLTFHLWLVLPLVLLFIPTESKWIDRVLQNLLRKSNQRMNARSSATSDLIEKQIHTQSSLDWTLAKMRMPLVIIVIYLLSSIVGFTWAFLHINTKVVSSSIVCGILFWTSISAVVSITKLIALLIQWSPTKFDPEIEALYMDLCYPFHIERKEFSKVLSCMKEIKTVKFGKDYVTEHMTRVDRLSLVLSGRLLVRQSGKMLHVVPNLHFVDSPEWFGVAADEFFQISATALEETKVLVWHRDKLKLILMKNPYLHTVFEHIIARDVVRKLTQSQDGTCMARDKTLDQMEYEDTILKNHRPKNTYVGLKGTVQILSEEDFANCK